MSPGALALALAFVAGGRATAPERELVVMAEEAHLTSWPVLEELAGEFAGARPDLTVRLYPLGGAAAQDKGKLCLAGDVPLDVLRIDVTELAAFVAEGALFDLRPWLEDAGFDERDYFEPVLDALRGEHGELYGLPSTFTPYVMYVNETLLAELGLEAPRPDWTWDEFLALARAATRDADGDGRNETWGVSLTQWLQAVVPWIWQNGGDVLDAEGRRSRIGEPEAVEALRFLQRLLHEERVASFDASLLNQMSQGMFRAGAALFYGPVGYWETFRFRHVREFEWDVLPLPRGRVRATSVAMTVYVVPRTSRHPDLAAQFVQRLAGPRYQRTLAEIGNGVPGLIEAALSPSFLKPAVPPESEHVFLETMTEARFLPPLANWRKIESICQAELEGILLVPGTDVEAACARMAAGTDAYLERERRRRALPAVPAAVAPAVGAGALALAAALFLARRRRSSGRTARREERGAYAMVAPWAVGFLAFSLGPAAVALLLALCEWSPLRPLGDLRWVGLENVQRLASDPTFHTSFLATLAYASLSVPLSLALALALALLVRSDTRPSAVVRTACYLPAIVSPVVVGAIWRSLLDPERGAIDALLARVGVDGPAWLRDPDWVVPAFVLTGIWTVGAQMLVFVAALQAVDPDLEDAARIDGASAWQRLRHVLLPALGPVILFNAVTGTIAAFQVFGQPYVMTDGGPGDASRFLVLYLYQSGFRHLDFGYAATIGWVLFVVLAGTSFAYLRIARGRVHYAGRQAR